MAFSFGRGETPYYSIKITGTDEPIDRIVVTFEQTKSGTEITLPDDRIHYVEKMGWWLQLTQEETLSIQRGLAKLQVRVKEKNQNAWNTTIMEGDIDDVLYEEVI